MLVIGITGGIGSGKSAVTALLADQGISVVDADIVAREVVAPGSPALVAIAKHFGENILDANGALDRAQLRQIIFSDPAEKTWLEALLHPIIRSETIRQLEQSQSIYTVLVSPLLLETDQHELVEYIVVVDVPESVQISRTMQRDNNDQQQVEAIIEAQISREQRLARANTVLSNAGNLEQLQAKVNTLHQQLIALSQQQSK